MKKLLVPPMARRLLVVSLVDAVGTGVFLAGSVVYFTLWVHLSGAEVGIGLGAAGMVAFLTTVPVSALADRFGAARLLVVLYVWRFCGFIAYAFVRNFWEFVLVACLIACGDRVASPVLQAIVGDSIGAADRVATMSWIRSTRNVGFSIGALACGALLAVGRPSQYRSIAVFDALTFLGAAGVLLRLPAAREHIRVAVKRRSLRDVADRRYVAATALNGGLTLHMSMLSVGVPLWVVSHTSLPHAWVAVLTVVNTVLAVVLQVPAGRKAGSPRGAGLSILGAGVALALACALYGAASGRDVVTAAVLMLAGMVAHTAGEVLQSGGAWAIAYDLAPDERRNIYLGVFSLGTTGQQIVGPPLLTAAVVASGFTGWVVLGAGLLATSLALACIFPGIGALAPLVRAAGGVPRPPAVQPPESSVAAEGNCDTPESGVTVSRSGAGERPAWVN